MPPGVWRRRPPLPPTAGTSVVCPIGEATPPQAAAYAAARNSNDEEDEMDDKLTQAELEARCADGEEPADVLAQALFAGRWFPPPPVADEED